MRIPFYGLWIETEIEGILEIRSLVIEEALNDHGFLHLNCLLDEDKKEAAVLQSTKETTVRVSETDGMLLYFGKLYSATTEIDHGKWELDVSFVSSTYQMDVKKRARVFYKAGDTYQAVMKRVTDLYPGTECRDEASNGKASPGVLLQYEETDWQFLKRLASHFKTFLVSDCVSEQDRFYFGIPDIDNGQVLNDWDYEILQNMEDYYYFGQGMKQSYLSWRITTPMHFRIGERLTFNGTDSVVTKIRIFSEKGEIRRTYTMHRRDGLLKRPIINFEIMGISLPVTVIARQKNLVQVEFDVNKPYVSEQSSKYFVYGIESSSFYCMPEVGSRAHVYFPTRNDWESVCVHALNPGAGAGKNPNNKTFSTPTGAMLQFTPSNYYFQSDGGGASTMNLGTDGIVTYYGSNITITAGSSVSIGPGKNTTPEVTLDSKGKQTYTVGGSTSIYETNLSMKAGNVKLKATTHGDQVPTVIPTESGGSGGNSGGGSGESDSNVKSKLTTGLPKKKFELAKGKQKRDKWDKLGDPTEEDSYFKKGNYDNQKDIPKENRKKFDKGKNVDIIGGEWSGSFGPGGKISDTHTNSWGEQSSESSISTLNWKATASAYAPAVTEAYEDPYVQDRNSHEDPKPYGVGIALGGSVSGMDIKMKGRQSVFGMEKLKGGAENNNLHAGAEASILKAEAKADIGFGQNSKGQTQVGLQAEAGAYLAEGSVSGGVSLFGVSGDLKASGKVGIGAELNAGWVDNKLTVKAGACFLLGGSVEFTLDFSGFFGIW